MYHDVDTNKRMSSDTDAGTGVDYTTRRLTAGFGFIYTLLTCLELELSIVTFSTQ